MLTSCIAEWYRYKSPAYSINIRYITYPCKIWIVGKTVAGLESRDSCHLSLPELYGSVSVTHCKHLSVLTVGQGGSWRGMLCVWHMVGWKESEDLYIP